MTTASTKGVATLKAKVVRRVCVVPWASTIRINNATHVKTISGSKRWKDVCIISYSFEIATWFRSACTDTCITSVKGLG